MASNTEWLYRIIWQSATKSWILEQVGWFIHRRRFEKLGFYRILRLEWSCNQIPTNNYFHYPLTKDYWNCWVTKQIKSCAYHRRIIEIANSTLLIWNEKWSWNIWIFREFH